MAGLLKNIVLFFIVGVQAVALGASTAGTNYLSAEGLAHLQSLSARTNGSFVSNSSATLPRVSSTNALPNSSLDDKQKLGIGDRVSFRIVEDKEDAKPLIVTDSGELEIPYVGRVAATGRTCRELAAEAKQLLERNYYYQATVLLAVELLNKAHGKIYLAGQIRLPGFQEIPSDEVFTVSKAILRAGGFSDFADKKHVKLTRKKGANDNEIITVDVAEVLEKGRSAKDVKLEADDLVFVPARILNF